MMDIGNFGALDAHFVGNSISTLLALGVGNAIGQAGMNSKTKRNAPHKRCYGTAI
jgi:hypothetical protein